MKRNGTRHTRPPQLPAPAPNGRARRADNGGLRETDLAVEPRAPARWPAISVCLIARNEAANLGPCLKSLGDLATEIIVVDTGSTDATADIARSLGARVYPFAWIDDFAAARNESLRRATGEWVFWLDADDRLSPKAVAQLERAAASGAADAYSCLVASRHADGVQDVTEHVRLFRNGLGIRFTGAIHERVIPDLARLGLRLAHTDVTVEHTGYSSPEVIRRKAARNLPVIEGQLTRDPDNVELLFYRGQTRFNLVDTGGAVADMREYLRRTRPAARFEYRRFWAYAVLALALQAEGDPKGMESLLEGALVEFPGHPYFLAMLARLHLAGDRAREALRGLLAAREALRGAVRGTRPSETWLELSLAESSRALGQREEAVRWAERARAQAPDWEQAGTTLARLYLEAGRIQEAESLLAGMVGSARGPEPWVVLWEVRCRQGRPAEAAAAMREARALGLAEEQAVELEGRITAARVLAATKSRGDSSPRHVQRQVRALALLSRGEHLAAAEVFAEAVQAEPSNPDNYRYLAVALRQSGHEEEALEAWRLGKKGTPY